MGVPTAIAALRPAFRGRSLVHAAACVGAWRCACARYEVLDSGLHLLIGSDNSFSFEYQSYVLEGRFDVPLGESNLPETVQVAELLSPIL
jgi:hypothetical protein